MGGRRSARPPACWRDTDTHSNAYQPRDMGARDRRCAPERPTTPPPHKRPLLAPPPPLPRLAAPLSRKNIFKNQTNNLITQSARLLTSFTHSILARRGRDPHHPARPPVGERKRPGRRAARGWPAPRGAPASRRRSLSLSPLAPPLSPRGRPPARHRSALGIGRRRQRAHHRRAGRGCQGGSHGGSQGGSRGFPGGARRRGRQRKDEEKGAARAALGRRPAAGGRLPSRPKTHRRRRQRPALRARHTEGMDAGPTVLRNFTRWCRRVPASATARRIVLGRWVRRACRPMRGIGAERWPPSAAAARLGSRRKTAAGGRPPTERRARAPDEAAGDGVPPRRAE